MIDPCDSSCDYACGCMADMTGVCECFDPEATDALVEPANPILHDLLRLRFARWMVQTGRLSDQIAPETRVAPRGGTRRLSVAMVCLTAALVALWLIVVLEMS